MNVKLLALTILSLLVYQATATNLKAPSQELVDDLKFLLMHYAESYLDNAKLRKIKLEGFSVNGLAKRMIPVMEEASKILEDGKLTDFAKSYSAFYRFQESAAALRDQSFSNFNQEASKLESRLFDNISVGNFAAFPLHWAGPNPHATFMIIKKESNTLVSIVLANTGSGVQYHYAVEDGSGVAPFLSKVWVEYKDVPISKLAENDYWFIQALGMLSSSEYMDESIKHGTPDKYLYGTLLDNLKRYRVDFDEDLDEDRYIRAQLSGSCAYSSVLGAVLYDSASKEEFLLRRLVIGQVSIKKFLEKYADNDELKSILRNSYDAIVRYLLRHVASGAALHALDYMENNVQNFSRGALIGRNRGADLSPDELEQAMQAIKKLPGLKFIKQAVQSGVAIHNYLKANELDPKTASVTPFDSKSAETANISIDDFTPAQFAFEKGDSKKMGKLRPDQNAASHPFVLETNKYEKEIPATVDSVQQVVDFLNVCRYKAEDLAVLDHIFRTHIYDFFKIALRRKEFFEMISSEATVYEAKDILFASAKIFRQFTAQAVLPMTIDDLAASTCLLLLTWKAAVRYDELCGTPIGLNSFAPPISGSSSAFNYSPIDPNGVKSNSKLVQLQGINLAIPQGYEYRQQSHDSCDVTPAWLSTEDDFEAWSMYQLANVELDKDEAAKPRFIPPPKLFPNPSIGISNFGTGHVELGAKNLELLASMAAPFKSSIDFYKPLYNNFQHLGEFMVLTASLTTPVTHPQFYYLLDVALAYYFGPLNRPHGQLLTTTPISIVIPTTLYFVYAMKERRHMRDKSQQNDVLSAYTRLRRLPMKPTVFDVLKYRRELLSKNLSSDFFDRQFADVRAADSLRDPRSIVRLQSYMNFIEGSKSTVFFKLDRLVFIADRLLGFKEFFVATQGPALIERLLEALKTAIVSDLERLHSNLEVISDYKKELVVRRILQTAFVLARFVGRVGYWVLKPRDEVASLIAELYNLFAPLGYFNSVFRLSDGLTSRIHTLLWFMVKMDIFKEKQHSTKFLKQLNISPALQKEPTSSLRAGLIGYHYFIGKSFWRRDTQSKGAEHEAFRDGFDATKNEEPHVFETFNLSYKAAEHFRFSPLLSKEAASIAANLITSQLIIRFSPEDKSNWVYKIIHANDVIEIRKSDSKDVLSFIVFRLSTGRIILNGEPYLTRTIIHQNLNYLLFFDETEQKYAKFGHLRHVEGKILYGLTNFRGTGKSFLLVTDGGYDAMDIYLKYDGVWWPWAKPTSEITVNLIESFRLMNLSGYRMFIRMSKDNQDLGIILIRDADQHARYRFCVKNFKNGSDAALQIRLPDFDEPMTLLNHSKYESILPPALEQFSRPEFISVYRTHDERSFIIYGPYRYGIADKLTPVMFEEIIQTDGSRAYSLVNDRQWVLDNDQSIASGIVMVGGLIIKSLVDGKRSLLAPRFEWKEKYLDTDYYNFPLIPVDSFMIAGGEVFGKNRMERLALAYRFMVGLDTNSARNFLHPAKSLDQNSVFTQDENVLLKWILTLTIENPEIYALQIMTATQVAINIFHFQQKYSGDHPAWSKKVLLQLLGSRPFKYLLSVREVPEKFYVHQSYRELECEDLFKLIFTNVASPFAVGPPEYKIPSSEFLLAQGVSINSLLISNAFLLAKGNRNAEVKDEDHFHELSKNRFKVNYASKIQEDNVYSLFRELSHPGVLENYEALHYRQHENPTNQVTSWSYDLLLRCVANEPAEKANFLKVIDGASNPMMAAQNGHVLGELMKFCASKYGDDLRPVLPPDQFDRMTDIDTTFFIFQENIKRRKFEEHDEKLPSAGPLLEKDNIKDIAAVDDVVEAVDDFILALNGTMPVKAEEEYFSDVLTGQSLVLRNLIHSIQLFKADKAIEGSTKIDLKLDSAKKITKSIKALISHVQNRVLDHNKDLADMKNRLLTLALDINDTSDDRMINQLNEIGHIRKAKTFESLYGCFYSHSLTCFKQKFPHLQEAQLGALRESTFHFYTRRILVEYFLGVVKQAETILRDTDLNHESLMAFISEIKKLESFEERAENVGILNFEYRSGAYHLRKEQMDDLFLLLAKDEKLFKSVVIQRMMAAGKTLVLGTLATVLKARSGNSLSILVPPASLFQSNSASMQSRTYKYFHTRGNVLHFERISLPGVVQAAKNVNRFWQWALYNIDSTISNRDYLILSPDSIQSFINSFAEFLNEYTTMSSMPRTELTVAYEGILDTMASIYGAFATNGSIILDEIHMTMNPKKELNFPTQERENYNPIAAVLTADLIEFSTFSKKIKKAGLDIRRNNQAGLTPEANGEVRKLWLEYIEGEIQNKDSIWHLKFMNPKHKDISSEKITDFLKSEEPHKHIKWINSICSSDEHKNQGRALAIMKMQIDRFLKDSFRATVKEHYGPPGNDRKFLKIAVPYVAANTPSESSLFADRWETLNKTLLMTVVLPVESSEVENIVIWLKEQINIESSKTLNPNSTVTYRNFSELLPTMNPLGIDIDDHHTMKKLRRALRSRNRASIRILLSYFLDTVLSVQGFPTEQFTSNALNLASIFSSVQGYSGTIENINILPPEVVPESYKDHEINDKNNGGIIDKILADSKNGHVFEAQGMESISSLSANIDTLLKARPVSDTVHTAKSKFHALIDVGAFLKNFRNAKVAETLLTALGPRIKCVLYYDEASNMLYFATNSSSKKGVSQQFIHGRLSLSDPDSITRTTGVEIQARFTFYDQRHITGSDILQPAGSYAILTVGPRNLLSDILQGTLRMRQFMTTQRVVLAITPDVVSYYNSVTKAAVTALTVSDVIFVAATNEDEKQSFENVGLTFAKIDSMLRKEVLSKITGLIFGTNFKKVCETFNKARSLFIRELREDPVIWLNKKKTSDVHEVVSNFLKIRSDTVDADVYQRAIRDSGIVEKCSSETNVNRSVFCFAPKTMPDYDLDSAGKEVQLELNALHLLELELDNVAEDKNDYDQPLEYRRFLLADCKSDDGLREKIIPMNYIINSAQQSPQTQQLMIAAFPDVGENISLAISRDLIEMIELPSSQFPYDPLGPTNRDGTHIFINQKDKSKSLWQVVLVSADVAQEMIQDPVGDCSTTWYLIDLMGKIVRCDSFGAIDGKLSIFSIKPKLDLAIFNLLVFNGSLQQLISEPRMSKYFFGTWLKRKEAALGLRFLMARMHVLQQKIKYLYETDDPLMVVINQIFTGDSEALGRLANQAYDLNVVKTKWKQVQATEFDGHAAGYYDKAALEPVNDEVEDDDNDTASVGDHETSSVSSDSTRNSAASPDESDSDDELELDEGLRQLKKQSKKTGLSFDFESAIEEIASDEGLTKFSRSSDSFRTRWYIAIGVVLVILVASGGGGSYYYFIYRKKLQPKESQDDDKVAKSQETQKVDVDAATDTDQIEGKSTET